MLLALNVLAQAAQPAGAVAALPAAAAWKQHFQRDILPFWMTPAALGSPVGNFPTFRCNDGALYDPRSPCPELAGAPDWIRAALGRQYVRMMSRQVFVYGTAFHLTGDPQYLLLARAGVRYIVEHGFDPATGGLVSYWQRGKPFAANANRSSQDLAYGLMGLSFYYYLTRDPYVLPPLLRVEAYIRQHYFDPRLGLYHLRLQGPEADRIDLVAQLDQANAYMLLAAPLLPEPDRQRWLLELTQIARAMRDRFYDRHSGFLLGTLAAKSTDGCVFDRVDTDFGHTIKGYWVLHFIARLDRGSGLDRFARDGAAHILQRAYLPDTGSWATQPTCAGKSGGKNGGIDRTSTWWMAAELDQAALIFGFDDARLLHYVPATFAFWLKRMVDPRYGEVWDEVTLPDLAPRLPKVHLWKNGFHPAEHALVGYIATSGLKGEPVVLYYAVPGCKLPHDIRPYYFDGKVTAHSETALPDLPGFCRAEVTFAGIR